VAVFKAAYFYGEGEGKWRGMEGEGKGFADQCQTASYSPERDNTRLFRLTDAVAVADNFAAAAAAHCAEWTYYNSISDLVISTNALYIVRSFTCCFGQSPLISWYR